MPMNSNIRHQNGMLMIEVLVTILIVSLGLLGIAAMFARSHLVSDEAYQRYQATEIAHQLSEQLTANQSEASLRETSTYVTGLSAPMPGHGYTSTMCSPCTSAQLAVRDLSIFHDSLIGTQKTKSGNNASALLDARGCVEYLGPKLGDPIDPEDPPRYRISVVWQGRGLAGTTVNPTLCANGIYSDARLRRVISLEVQIL